MHRRRREVVLANMSEYSLLVEELVVHRNSLHTTQEPTQHVGTSALSGKHHERRCWGWKGIQGCGYRLVQLERQLAQATCGSLCVACSVGVCA